MTTIDDTIASIEKEAQEMDTLEYKVSQEIANNVELMCSDKYFANVIRCYYESHQREYSDLLKQYKNDFPTMCCQIVANLNQLLTQIPVESKKWVDLNNEIKILEDQVKVMIEQGVSVCDGELMNLQAEVLKGKTKLSRIQKTEIKDKSYKSTLLSGLIDKVMNALASIEQTSEPSDIEMRQSLRFEKKMSLEEALFTLLWNTRNQTIQLSTLNIKGWAASLAQRLTLGEANRTNLPTMLIFRSRSDSGSIKGSSGKSTIAYSCCDMLVKKGLNVAGQFSGVQIPTNDRIDKNMSDKSLVLFEDMRYSGVAWEELNKFLDGLPIKNRGKYLKEGAVFGFGNVIGTTNYDISPYYSNLKRYPEIEFTANDAAIGSKHQMVIEHAKYKQDNINRKYDFTDAWETLLSYACDNYTQWLYEYEKYKDAVRMKCSIQRTKLDNLIFAFFEHQREHNLCCGGTFFTPREVVDFIKENFRSELPYVPKIQSVVDALENLGVSELTGEKNIYSKRYSYPSESTFCDESMFSIDSITSVWNWLVSNASMDVKTQLEGK